MKECKSDRHKIRDNNFGVTWCIKCGKLMNKPTNRPISVEDIAKHKPLLLTLGSEVRLETELYMQLYVHNKRRK